MRVIRFIGLRRSGQHAVINWVRRQAPDDVLFVNDVGNRHWASLPSGRLRLSEVAADRRLAESLAAHPKSPVVAGRYEVTPDLLLFNVEDLSITEALAVPAADLPADVTVVVLRDPYNTMASRLRGLAHGVPPAEAVAVWKDHARAFSDGRFLPVSFNDWCASRPYRKWLAARLGVPFTDGGRDDVPPWGGGSSFDGDAFHGAASRMAVAERYREYAATPGFRALFDRETADLAERLFGLRLPEAP